MSNPAISIIGTGFVGLCTGVGFASKGYQVTTSTHDPEKAALINSGVPPFYEPGLEKLLQKTVRDGRLKCVVDQEEAVLSTDLTFVAVGTPSLPHGGIDLKYVERAAHEIGEALGRKDSYHLVIMKSTVVPETTEKVLKPTLERESQKQCGIRFGLCMNPEFLREGSALHDTFYPDRVIIGEVDKESGETLERFYRDFYAEKMPPAIRTNLATAELIKYANNSFLATKISFINEIANICNKIPEADVKTVAEGIGLDRRINKRFLNAGLGYGGSCLPKDVDALVSHSKKCLRYEPQLLSAVVGVNSNQIDRAIQLARKTVGDLKGKRIAILGLAFKPETDDMREAVSIRIIKKLLSEGSEVVAYDPVAVSNARSLFKEAIQYADSAIECLKGADCCILTTEWEEFKKLKPKDFVQNMNNPALVDGRRIYNHEEFRKEMGFAAIGLGD